MAWASHTSNLRLSGADRFNGYRRQCADVRLHADEAIAAAKVAIARAHAIVARSRAINAMLETGNARGHVRLRRPVVRQHDDR